MSRIIRDSEVKAKTGYSKTQRRRMEARGEFPVAVRLGPRAIGWYEHEVDEWVRGRIRGHCERPSMGQPTGAGKTGFAAAILVDAERAGQRVLFIAGDQTSLADLAVE